MISGKVALIGCGYLGEKVALELQERTIPFLATTRSKEHCQELEEKGIPTFTFESHDLKRAAELFADCDTFIVSVAPSNGGSYEETYLATAKTLSALFSDKRLIYISSTSVYSENEGHLIDENAPLEKGAVLVETERVFSKFPNHLFLRLSGLYGPGRLPLESLMKGISGPKEIPSNMIHVDDVVKAIFFFLEREIKGVFNLTDDARLTRERYYEALAQAHHLPPPIWNESGTAMHSKNRWISNEKIKSVGFHLTYPERLYDC